MKKCTTHNTYGCVCLWTSEQLANAGIAVKSRGAVGMDSRTISPPTKPVANDALTDDEMSLIEMAIRSVHKPAARRAPAGRDSRQLRDFYGQPVSHELAANEPAVLTEPLKWKAYKYDGN